MTLRALFVDFDSYFAAVEQQERPALRGKPVAVLPVLAETTSCIAASYEARRFGVKTGTRVAEARRLCPDIQWVLARHDVYVQYHHRLVAAVDECAPVIGVHSIDEMCCSLNPDQQTAEPARALALRIKQRIAARVGDYISCSIGIAPNAFLAKTASDMEKPNGITVLDTPNLPHGLYGLALRDLCGIGARTEARLHNYGITSVEHLCAASKTELRRVWGGIEGERFHARLRGVEVYVPPTQRASIGHSHVLPPELRSDTAAQAVLQRLLQKAAMRLRKMGYVAGGMAIHIRYIGDERWDEEARCNTTQDTFELTHVFAALWARGLRPAQPPLKVGVTLLRLVEKQASTRSLFEPDHKHAALLATVDRLNARFGKNTVYFAGAHQGIDAAPMRIAFNRIPDLDVEQ